MFGMGHIQLQESGFNRFQLDYTPTGSVLFLLIHRPLRLAYNFTFYLIITSHCTLVTVLQSKLQSRMKVSQIVWLKTTQCNILVARCWIKFCSILVEDCC